MSKMELNVLIKNGTTLLVTLMIVLYLSAGFYWRQSTPVQYCTAEQEAKQAAKHGQENYGGVMGSESQCQSTIQTFVNRLNSHKTVLPYEYNSFDFCRADSADPVYTANIMNIGQILLGDRLTPSSIHNISFMESRKCVARCNVNTFQADLELLRQGIRLEYHHHWMVDDLPLAYCYSILGGDKFCRPDFPMGCYVDPQGKRQDACLVNLGHTEPDTYYLFNHLDITVEYHTPQYGGPSRLIAAEVQPKSMQRSCSFDAWRPMVLPKNGTLTIPYSYSIKFRENAYVTWSSRWDYVMSHFFLKANYVHWFSMLNSLFVAFFLLVSLVAARFQRQGVRIRFCKKIDESAMNGWKYVSADVFRAPNKGLLLSVFLGNGVQLFFTVLISLILSCSSMFSPSDRGSLMTFALRLYTCLGLAAGYVCARMYKTFGGEKWKLNVSLTAFLCQGICFGLVLILNGLFFAKGSSAAVPCITVLHLLALWLGVSVPFTFVGYHFGFKEKAIKPLVEVNEVPRPIPKIPMYKHPTIFVFFGGMLTFGCIFQAQYFVLQSLWNHRVYDYFGFLVLKFLLLTVICSGVTMFMCENKFALHDYHWWWPSFVAGSGTAVYSYLYCVLYFFLNTDIADAFSTVLYFGISLLMVFLVFLVTGTIGFFASFWHVRRMYSGFDPKDVKGSDSDIDKVQICDDDKIVTPEKVKFIDVEQCEWSEIEIAGVHKIKAMI